MDVRANPGAHRARMDVRANPGAFYAPFLFAPTIAALRPHHIGRIPAHSMRHFYSPLRLPRHDRITSGEYRRIPYGRIPAHSVRHFYSPLRLPRHDRIASGESRRIPYGRIPAHSMRRFYSPLRLPRYDRITSGEYRRIPCAVFIRPYDCRATTASADSPTHS